MSNGNLDIGFDTDRYFVEQMSEFRSRIPEDGSTIVEFGGKPFGDYHAARVLPGYEPDLKAEIIQSLVHELGQTTLVFAINARDILEQPDGRRTERHPCGNRHRSIQDRRRPAP